MVDMISMEQMVLSVRGQRVILDSDLAALFGVRTKALNQAIERNRSRFPEDFVFRLTTSERAEVVTKCDRLSRLKFSSSPPLAFTEHGALMAANVLNSAKAVEASVWVVRTFIRLRQFAVDHLDLTLRLDELE